MEPTTEGLILRASGSVSNILARTGSKVLKPVSATRSATPPE